MALTLEQFSQDLQQAILSDSSIQDAEDFAENVFTRHIMDYLAEAGEMGDGDVCYYQARGLKINGYVADYDDDCLNLIVALYRGAESPGKAEKAKVEAAFRQARSFLLQSLDSLHLKMEESSPAFSLAQIIHSLKAENSPLSRVRVFLISDDIVNVDPIKDEVINGFSVSYYVRDIQWISNWWNSGQTQEKIEIDFTQRPGGPLRCLKMPVDNGEYQTYLAIVPAELLFSIYNDFRARLLERNVRSFLQAKGSVNRGIRKTLLNEPHRFLAYNNGLTATAEAVYCSDDGSAIERIHDLQIVNGGQTTASIFHTVLRDKADLSQVFVQMKLSVVNDPAQLDKIVPCIAEYANSQNKVNLADFSANTPFHRRIEELSRNVWAPPAKGIQNQTRWFYERARGQYADARNSELTPARMKAWDKLHPRSQMFAKTDLAKFEQTWMQRPYIVSRGAQKNFADFTLELDKRGDFEPDIQYFERMIARAILFKTAEKAIGAQNYGGYRANIVTYTLAYLSFASQQRLNFDAIWKQQDISTELREAVKLVSKYVYDFITSPPGGRNVTEWCKSEKCWLGIKELEIELSPSLKKEFIAVGKNKSSSADKGIAGPDGADSASIKAVCEVSAEIWLGLSAWAKATDNLQSWQRGIAYSIGRLITEGKEPSYKQANHGLQILQQARQLGFIPENL